jgi:hypothetical protein
MLYCVTKLFFVVHEKKRNEESGIAKLDEGAITSSFLIATRAFTASMPATCGKAP